MPYSLRRSNQLSSFVLLLFHASCCLSWTKAAAKIQKFRPCPEHKSSSGVAKLQLWMCPQSQQSATARDFTLHWFVNIAWIWNMSKVNASKQDDNCRMVWLVNTNGHGAQAVFLLANHSFRSVQIWKSAVTNSTWMGVSSKLQFQNLDSKTKRTTIGHLTAFRSVFAGGCCCNRKFSGSNLGIDTSIRCWLFLRSTDVLLPEVR